MVFHRTGYYVLESQWQSDVIQWLSFYLVIDNIMRVASFPDGSFLEYDKGQFDSWCVYLTRPAAQRYAPRDYEYFQRLSEMAAIYGAQTIYDDFVSLYEHTTNNIVQETLNLISLLCVKYGEHSTDMAIDFTILYMGMVAEENKAKSKLGKRIKRLGVHQVLQENINYYKAANFSRGRNWRELAALCEQRGF